MKHSTKEDGSPGFYFFAMDWISAPDLAVCSLASQGLWIRLLCYMSLAPKKGYLLLPNGDKMNSKTIAKLTGEGEEGIALLLTELKEKGVSSEDEGVVYNRRMVRDWELSQKRQEAGLKGLAKRWHKKYSKPDSKVIASGDSKTIANIGKDRIGKDKYLEFVYLSKEEFKKLEDGLGKERLSQMIERLNNYIGSKGVKYRSHYHTILNWIAKDGGTTKEEDDDGENAH